MTISTLHLGKEVVMNYMDYYSAIKPEEIINPSDLSKTFPELVAKAESLDRAEAPRMLISFMFSLALEIEINRHSLPAIINPKNPEPLTLVIMAKSVKEMEEKIKILQILKQSGWIVEQINDSCFVKLSVDKPKAKPKAEKRKKS